MCRSKSCCVCYCCSDRRARSLAEGASAPPFPPPSNLVGIHHHVCSCPGSEQSYMRWQLTLTLHITCRRMVNIFLPISYPTKVGLYWYQYIANILLRIDCTIAPPPKPAVFFNKRFRARKGTFEKQKKIHLPFSCVQRSNKGLSIGDVGVSSDTAVFQELRPGAGFETGDEGGYRGRTTLNHRFFSSWLTLIHVSLVTSRGSLFVDRLVR